MVFDVTAYSKVDIGNAVALLYSERASWIIGQIITVDEEAPLRDTLLPVDLERGLTEKFLLVSQNTETMVKWANLDE